MNGVVTDSPLLPVIANFLLEDFEEGTVSEATCQSCCCFQYTDITFVIWLHGSEKLGTFLDYLKSIKSSVQFSMETEKDGHFLFWILISTRDLTAPWIIQFSGMLLSETCILMLGHTTILPTSILFYLI
jgi:hypothetical protein